MTDANTPPPPSLSYVKAENRNDAVRRMIRPNPLLSALYVEGESKDGKDGWVNAIRDQGGKVYRLLFYIDKLPVAPEFTGMETYEVLYGSVEGENKDGKDGWVNAIRDQGGKVYRLLFYIDKLPVAPEHTGMETYEVLYGSVEEQAELNYPRALFTTTGAINLMRDGIPGERFVNAVRQGILEIVPHKLGRDVKTEWLRESGYAYLCVYDRDGQGIRILDLLDYLMVYDHRPREEIQVHQEEELVIGDTRFVRPFLLKYARRGGDDSQGTSSAAEQMLRNNL